MISDDLKKLIVGDVKADDETLFAYSHDYSVFEVKPAVVVYPKNHDDVKTLVRFVGDHKTADPPLSLTARSAGTDMSGGPLNESIILDFTKYFNQIKEIGPDHAVVEPGVYFRDFEKAIDAKGLLYPPYPASKDLCAMGGIVSNNSGGEKTLMYGQTREYVEAVSLILSDGEEHTFRELSADELQTKLNEKSFEGNLYQKIYKLIEDNYDDIKKAKPAVTKNSAGYALWDVWDRKTFNLAQLIVGAQGTLGIMTQARIKLIPKKKRSRLAVIFIHDLNIFGNIIEAARVVHPESLEFYDDKTLGVALRFLPDLVARMREGLLTLALEFLPEFFMALRGGMPKIILLVELTGEDDQEITKRMGVLKESVATFPVQIRVLRDEKEARKYWTVRRASFALLHEHNRDRATVPFVDDVIVRPEDLPSFLPKINAIIDKHKKKMIYTIAGHAGDGNIHIIPLMDLKDPEARALIPEVTDEVYKLVLEYKGSITAEHNDGLIRTPYLKDMYGEKIYGLFEDVKKIFDPQNIFNPRKKVGGDMAYALAHIKKK
ncbi:FAD-binding oxidoreductase [Candidatus Wolfebacteria bacterium]|nr:FAD-binding oxidoreductase [Candidatus Wolfebacteria bacterium]